MPLPLNEAFALLLDGFIPFLAAGLAVWLSMAGVAVVAVAVAVAVAIACCCCWHRYCKKGCR